MSYHVYQTEGFIVGSVPVNEASKYITIYTKDLGLVRGVAQGVRNLRSKLKHSLQDLSYSKISFVRGKEVWRIVNSERLEVLKSLDSNKEKREFIAKTSSILKRFVRGEERDDDLFSELKTGFLFLDREEFLDDEMKNFELIFVLRILKHLGYLPNDKILSEDILKEDWSKDFLNRIKGKEEEMISIINNSISHSHL